jgi:ABC-2 type transport system ATP-binding protein
VNEIISIRGLCKRYGPAGSPLALADVDLDVRSGEMLSLLGPNGAGKTSLLGVLSGLLPPTAGDACVAGHSVTREPMAVKRVIGVVPEEIALYPQLSARRNLRYFAALYGLNGAAREQAVAAALDEVGLAARADQRVGQYSNGMKRRLNIAAGLLHGPRVLLLDEPTAGLDPESRHAILDLVRRLKQENGVTIVYTTHNMAEAEEISDRVGIIHQGRLIALGTPAELIATLHAEDTLRLHLDGSGPPPAAALAALQRLPGVGRLDARPGTVTFAVAGAADVLPAVLAAAGAAGIGVRSLTVEQPNLEAVFLRLTGRSLGEPPGAAG